MAKQPLEAGSSRIRFIMLDAEIPEGNLSQITSAIQNALKPVLPLFSAETARGGEGPLCSASRHCYAQRAAWSGWCDSTTKAATACSLRQV
jgi:hypothetical protein